MDAQERLPELEALVALQALVIVDLKKDNAGLREQLEVLQGRILDLQHRLFQAFHDGLTGLLLRDPFARRAPGLMKRTPVDAPQLVHVAVVDFDKLKPRNSELTHRGADLLLAAVGRAGQALERDHREEVLMCRQGGDEFVVLIVGVDELQAKALINELRKNAFDEVVATVLLHPSSPPDGLGLVRGIAKSNLEDARARARQLFGLTIGMVSAPLQRTAVRKQLTAQIHAADTLMLTLKGLRDVVDAHARAVSAWRDAAEVMKQFGITVEGVRVCGDARNVPDKSYPLIAELTAAIRDFSKVTELLGSSLLNLREPLPFSPGGPWVEAVGVPPVGHPGHSAGLQSLAFLAAIRLQLGINDQYAVLPPVVRDVRPAASQLVDAILRFAFERVSEESTTVLPIDFSRPLHLQIGETIDLTNAKSSEIPHAGLAS